MRNLAIAFAVSAALASSMAAQLTREGASTEREVIAVYIGSAGTDLATGMSQVLRDMKKALLIETASTRRSFVLRGISLGPSAADGAKHLAALADFDEVSAGRHWTNSALLRYLGNEVSPGPSKSIPQLILLEREINHGGEGRFTVTPERELRRFIGLQEITEWVRTGARLPK